MMNRFLICTLPLAGHVNPALPVAHALVARGHEVWWYTGRKFRPALEAVGATYAPMQATVATDVDDFFRKLPDLKGLQAANWGIKRAFIDPLPGQVADLQQILTQFPADVILCDQVFAGAEAVHDLGGPPWAMFSVSGLTLSSRDTAPANTTLPPSASPFGRLRNWTLNTLINRVALAHGIPLIVAAGSEEKPAIAARVAWSGAGINLKTGSPTPEQIRTAVHEVLANPRYRQNAQRIQADYARHQAPTTAATLLEQLATTKRPVFRGQQALPGGVRPVDVGKIMAVRARSTLPF